MWKGITWELQAQKTACGHKNRARIDRRIDSDRLRQMEEVDDTITTSIMKVAQSSINISEYLF